MTKAADAFRTISEVAEALGTPAHVLRFWESKFSQVKPVKMAGGRRYYRPSDLALLSGIKVLLHERGMTIRGVQKMLREEGVKQVAAHSSVTIGQAVPAETAAPAPGVQRPASPPPPGAQRPAPPPSPEPAPAAVAVSAAPEVTAAPAEAALAAAQLASVAPMLFEALPEQPASPAARPAQRAPHAPTPGGAHPGLALWSERLRGLKAPGDPAALARLHAQAQALRNRLAALARA